MKRTFLIALCIASLPIGAAVLAPNAIAADDSLPGQNHYILCDKGEGCTGGIGGPIAAPAYRIESVYSDLAGWFQYIELREDSADGKVTPLAGSIITVRHGDAVKQFVVPHDPPAGFPAGGSLVISTIADLSQFLVRLDAASTSIAPDYVMPERFLPTDGGTIDFDGRDPWTFDALPTDGSTELLRSGEPAPARWPSFVVGDWGGYLREDIAIEYYNVAHDHYFVTASEPDIDAIESGRTKGWRATAYNVGVFSYPYPMARFVDDSGAVMVPVCRFYIPPELGDSHFFSASAQECAEVAAKFPTFVKESDAAFYVVKADEATGACGGVDFSPVYRLWNRRPDTNHRYTAFPTIRDQMITQGWLPEGFGPLGVAWCQ